MQQYFKIIEPCFTVILSERTRPQNDRRHWRHTSGHGQKRYIDNPKASMLHYGKARHYFQLCKDPVYHKLKHLYQ